MLSTSEYQSRDATGLAELVRSGEVSATELLRTAQRLAAERNPRLNAIIRELPDTAERLLRSHPADAPFAGVPFLLKDLLAHLEGTPLSAGSAALKTQISPHTSEHVRRCLDAGLLIFGKTNTPEFGLLGTTEPRAFGPTHNPWDRSRTAGGSSGGSAAAVAGGIVPMALGGDGGGSIRIPASCCGLFGFKPSRGLTPTGPDASEFWEGAAVQHVITRSVRDSATMLDLTCGPDVGAAWPVPKPQESFLECSRRDPPPLRVAYSTRSPLGGPVAQACVDAVNAAVKLLRELGHEAEEAAPALDGDALVHAYLTLYAGQTAADVRSAAESLGQRPGQLEIEPATRMLAAVGGVLSARDYVLTRRLWNGFARCVGRFHEGHDIWLTPTLADVPQPLGSLVPSRAEQRMMSLVSVPGVAQLALTSGALGKMARPLLEKTPFTQVANFTGQPAMSVPLHQDQGLPVGVQLCAAIGHDGQLFSLAGQLERAHPWNGLAPMSIP